MRSSVALSLVKRAQLRYASSNKETLALSRTMQPKYKSTLNKLDAYRSVFAQLMLDARIEVTAIYALNYLKLQVLKLTYVALFLSANIIALIGTVLYNAIKEYYDDRTRKIIYFYSYTIEKDYNCVGKQEDNILTIDKCRTGYSNKKDIEANEREEETRVQLRKLLEEIHDILLREFRRANNFTEKLEDCNALVERYEEEINCSNLYSTM
ncbi:hypothetical protein HBI75_175750 [Parastagonospora nodorum]|nr:hypothetical protein HBI75_175750 [Parastagonospora nodorum]